MSRGPALVECAGPPGQSLRGIEAVNVLTLTIARDEEPLIPYFVRHYRRFGDVMVFDDASVDGTARAAEAAGAAVFPVQDGGGDEVEFRIIEIKNNAWIRHRDRYVTG